MSQTGFWDPEPEPESDPVEEVDTGYIAERVERLVLAANKLLDLVHEFEPERENKPAWVELRQANTDVRELLWDQVSLETLHSTPGKVGVMHPETSHQAARLVRAGTQRHHLLWLLYEAGESGLTSFEATSGMKKVRPDMAPNQTATRMGELRDDYRFVKRKTHAGVTVTRRAAKGEAEVYVLTAPGFDAIEKLGQP